MSVPGVATAVVVRAAVPSWPPIPMRYALLRFCEPSDTFTTVPSGNFVVVSASAARVNLHFVVREPADVTL